MERATGVAPVWYCLEGSCLTVRPSTRNGDCGLARSNQSLTSAYAVIRSALVNQARLYTHYCVNPWLLGIIMLAIRCSCECHIAWPVIVTLTATMVAPWTLYQPHSQNWSQPSVMLRLLSCTKRVRHLQRLVGNGAPGRIRTYTIERQALDLVRLLVPPRARVGATGGIRTRTIGVLNAARLPVTSQWR